MTLESWPKSLIRSCSKSAGNDANTRSRHEEVLERVEERKLWRGRPFSPRTANARGVAVAVDGEVVPRAGWQTFRLHDHARVEVLTAMQGG